MVFRRGGSVAVWFVEGTVPSPNDAAFAEGLRAQRFRSIETAASEERSAGWVSPDDPTGESFAAEAMIRDPGIWLRMRVDTKKLPAAWVAIHRAAAERAAGRRLTVRERRELKADLMQTLLPRILPGVQLVDGVLYARRSLLMLMSTSRSSKEEFVKLFQSSFGVKLLPADPLVLAERAGLPARQTEYLTRVSPVRWPRAGDEVRNGSDRPVPAPRPRLVRDGDDGVAAAGAGEERS